jgi:TPR repeat protein
LNILLSRNVKTAASVALFVTCLFAGAPTHAQNDKLSPSDQKALSFIETGLKYEHGEGVGRDYALAQDAYCNAAKLNFADGYVRLGWMYANGRGVPKNDIIAGTLFKKASVLGSDVASRLSEMIKTDEDLLPTCLSTVAKQTGFPQQGNLPALPSLPKLAKVATFSALTPADKLSYAATVVSLAKEFRLDPRLVLAVMRAESNYDPTAKSNKGAQGLMQLIPETAERFGLTDVTDPAQNIKGGMAYLKWLLSLFKGDVVLSLAAYNAGEKTVEKFNGVPPYPETMAYVQKIRSVYPLDFHAFDERAASFRFDKKKNVKK